MAGWFYQWEHGMSMGGLETVWGRRRGASL
uniref:Uncharacterized protein n=1 Tax=Moniliophthora roreri TaxID=221103 RepID=A0A0W0G0F4_MONRR